MPASSCTPDKARKHLLCITKIRHYRAANLLAEIVLVLGPDREGAPIGARMVARAVADGLVLLPGAAADPAAAQPAAAA